MEQEAIEMGTSDQVLVPAKKSKKLAYGIGFIAMVAAIAVVVTLVVVFATDIGGHETTTTTPEGPTTVTPITTTTTTTTTPNPDITETDSPITIPAPTTLPPLPEIDLDAILNGQFSPTSFNGTWISSNEILFRNSDGNLVKYNVDEYDPLILVSNTSEYLINSYQFSEMSADQRYIALSFNEEIKEWPRFPTYFNIQSAYCENFSSTFIIPMSVNARATRPDRYSFLSYYIVLDTLSREEYRITPPDVTESNAMLQNFIWAPSGSGFAFVYENNVYYQSNVTSIPSQVSNNGIENVIYNGVPDWVYEEEVFASNNAIWFSSDGNTLAYATFNDTDVGIMRIPNFGTPGSLEHQYTTHREIRFPKSGTINPVVSVTVRNLNNEQITYNAPVDLTGAILKTVTFVNSNTIGVMWTDRVQTQFVVELCTLGTACQRIYSYTQTNGWIDNIPLIFNEQGTSFITIIPFTVNNELYKQVVQASQTTTTDAPWTLVGRSNTAHTVLKILKWTSNDVIWYLATRVGDSAEQHVYSLSTSGVTCFTCDLRRPDGEQCLYNDAIVTNSNETTRITLNCNGPNVPQVLIYNGNGILIKVWEENEAVAELSTAAQLPVTFWDSVSLGTGLQDGKVLIQAPRDYLSRTNLPLLVYVYAGPDTAQVTKQWTVDWGTYLVNRFDMVVAKIDGRGSGLQGVQQMFAVNRQLGSVEIEDQITVTKFLQDRFSFIDSNRTCIWGWSYGGYAASLALARGGDVFRCAMAVAPVVDWHYYDTIYTERYMDMPQANPDAYAASSLLTDSVVESYRNKSYLLVHGTEDDNVHYQHSMLFSRRLQLNDVYFKQMSYTDEDHGLGGVRQHLYHALEKFLREKML